MSTLTIFIAANALALVYFRRRFLLLDAEIRADERATQEIMDRARATFSMN